MGVADAAGPSTHAVPALTVVHAAAQPLLPRDAPGFHGKGMLRYVGERSVPTLRARRMHACVRRACQMYATPCLGRARVLASPCSLRLPTLQRYLRFDDGDRFIKVGTDSPENLLAYYEFDGACACDRLHVRALA